MRNMLARLTGWRAFLALWAGQAVSLVGSGLFAFAVGVWVYQKTGSATLFALILFFDILPGILMAPYAGGVVDRVNRRKVMLLGNIGCAVSTLMVAGVALSAGDGVPNVWLLYPALIVGSIAAAFHGAAYEASLALLIEERHLGRANGLIQLGGAIAEVGAPVLAGVLLLSMQVYGLIMLDFATFVVAIAALLLLRIPDPVPEPGHDDTAPSGRVRDDLRFGWRYITSRGGLLTLLVTFAMLNFFINLSVVAVTPLVLAFGDAAALGLVVAAGGAGMIAGGLVMTAWGGTKRRIHGLLAGLVVASIFITLYGLRPSALIVGIGAFGFFFVLPIVNASSAAIWQSQVPPSQQGRVFAVRRMLAQLGAPLAFLMAGPLLDGVFRDLLVGDGWVARTFGPIFGTGPSRGIGLVFVLMGGLMLVVALAGVANPKLRAVEDAPPPADVQPEPAPAAA